MEMKNKFHETSLLDSQKGLYFLSKNPGGSSAYNMLYTYKIKGKICLSALSYAASSVIKRHVSLQWGFEENNGEICRFTLENSEQQVDYKYIDHR